MNSPKVSERAATLPHPALANADWIDSWQVVVPNAYADARLAAKAIVAAFPRWTQPLLALRTVLVLPFGLKGGGSPKADRIAFFPVVSERRERIVAGFDDRHLDFRIVVDLESVGSGQNVSLTTVIARHNTLGRIYLMLVLPFHRAIIRSALRQLSRA